MEEPNFSKLILVATHPRSSSKVRVLKIFPTLLSGCFQSKAAYELAIRSMWGSMNNSRRASCIDHDPCSHLEKDIDASYTEYVKCINQQISVRGLAFGLLVFALKAFTEV